ncbi:MAG TPA: SDR family NAD(P)-dependent oxidoreductase [Stellaceae bacterium]
MPPASSNQRRLRGIVVTGASSGIGAEVCRRLAGPGQAVLVHARKNREGAERTAEAVRAAGGEASVLLADIAEPGAAARVVEEAASRFGGVDVLVSNAGFADRRPFGELTGADLAASVAAVQTAFFELVTAALPHLRRAGAAGYGRVVAVSSFAAHVFRPDVQLFPASAAAKAGVEAMVKALAVQLAPDGVTVNAVAPGFTRKDAGAHTALDEARWRQVVERIPLGRLGRPEDAAAAVAWLVSEEAGYVTGQVLHVDGGLLV